MEDLISEGAAVHRHVGERIKLDKCSSWRSLYPVYQNRELIAYLGMPAGWGRGWRIYPLMLASKDSKYAIDGVTIDARRGRGWLVSYKDGKEQVAEWLERHMKDDFYASQLKTASQVKAEHEKQANFKKRLDDEYMRSLQKQIDDLQVLMSRWQHMLERLAIVLTADEAELLKGRIAALSTKLWRLGLELTKEKAKHNGP